MGAFLVYIIKCSLLLSAFFLFYKLLLSKETFHRFNRIFLISILSLSVILPFIKISFEGAGAADNILKGLSDLTLTVDSSVAGEDGFEFTTWHFVILLYLVGALVALFGSVLAMFRMWRLIYNGRRVSTDRGESIVLTDQKIAPFSWFGYIVLNEGDYNEESRSVIIHEMAHVKKLHSIDILLAELVIIFQWFSPASYLLKRELRDIHEFEADEEVINSGADARSYQLLLIKKAVGSRLYSMANSFNHSKLKKRITMMVKKKSKRSSAAKALFLLPLTALALTAFASEKVSSVAEEVSKVKINDFIKSDTVKGKKIFFTVRGDSVTIKDSSPVTIGTDTIIVVTSMTNGTTVKKNVHVKRSVSTKVTSLPDGVIYIVDGKEVANLDGVDKDDIHSMNILKGDVAVAKYGKKATKGAIEITKKHVMVYRSGKNDSPLIIVDGVECKNMDDVDQDNIDSMTILKDKSAKDLYGEKAKNGVIIITTKTKK